MKPATAVRCLLLLVSFAIPPTDLSAQDTLETARQSGVLRWGADQEGGAPFIFPDPDDQRRLIGFEVDLARRLEAELGVTLRFQQSQWDALPSMLRARKVDVVMNGYEWMPERAATMEASIPYYVYALQLEVRRDSPIQRWEQLKRAKPNGSRWKFGILSGSAAEAYLEQFRADGGMIELAAYDGVTDAMREVETGKVDATLQDTPIANYYARDFPNLRFVDEPVAPGYYVVYARNGDKELITAINTAISKLYRNGELRRIYTKYEMWNEDQAILEPIIDAGKFYGILDGSDGVSETAEDSLYQATGERRSKGWDYLQLLGLSAGMTIALSVLSFPMAITIGMLVAIGRLYGPGWLRVPLAAYVEFLRGTPLMLQLYFIFYLLPELGVIIPPFPTAVLGLAINYSAYESEIYRAGLQAIPRGQMEAALSLGMTPAQAIRRIIVPQAFRIVIPPVVNDFIAMFKDTSVCSVVTIVELTKRFSVLSRNNVADLVVLMLITALLYLAMSYPMSLVARRIEKRLEEEPRG